jgi:hypothetical protein
LRSTYCIEVKVEPGIFKVEPHCSFYSLGRYYGLFVCESDVENNRIPVWPLKQEGDSIMIRLPRETWASGINVWIAADQLLTWDEASPAVPAAKPKSKTGRLIRLSG